MQDGRTSPNILFTCVGRKISVVQAFRKALTRAGITGEIIGVDMSPFSPVLTICDHSYLVPRTDADGYIPTLLKICHKHEVGLLIPLIDLDLIILAEHKRHFAESGTLVMVSDPQVVRTCRNKWSTYRFFTDNGIPTVQTFTFDQLDARELKYPMFIKPVSGSGSINTYKINNDEELAFFGRYVPSPIIQEFAEGNEYTLDALVDLAGNVINIVPRQRIEVRAGEISKGVTSKNWVIIEEAVRLLEKLGAVGPVTIQCFWDGQQVKFTEINPRLGGGIPLSIAAGADYPSQIIKFALGESVMPCIGGFQDGLYMFRYEEAVFAVEEQVFKIHKHNIV